MTPLTDLATKHGTDKWNNHWYAQHYDRYFTPWREKPVRVLEIGIGGYDDPKAGGQSLRMWQEYFPDGTIVGLDIVDKSAHRDERIHTVQGSQVDLPFLDRVIAEHGPFDIVIDDGSHLCEHVVTSFEYLFVNGLVDGGIYAAEDLQTSYWPSYGGAISPRSRRTSVAYFKGLADCTNWMEQHRPRRPPTYFDEHVFGLHFHHSLVFVEKLRGGEVSNFVHDRVVPFGFRAPIRDKLLYRWRRLRGSTPNSDHGSNR